MRRLKTGIKGEGSESWLVRKWYRENYDRVEALVLQGLAIQSVSSITDKAVGFFPD